MRIYAQLRPLKRAAINGANDVQTLHSDVGITLGWNKKVEHRSENAVRHGDPTVSSKYDAAIDRPDITSRSATSQAAAVSPRCNPVQEQLR